MITSLWARACYTLRFPVAENSSLNRVDAQEMFVELSQLLALALFVASIQSSSNYFFYTPLLYKIAWESWLYDLRLVLQVQVINSTRDT